MIGEMVEPAEIGQDVPDRRQHGLGDPVEELPPPLATNWLRVFTTLKAISQDRIADAIRSQT